MTVAHARRCVETWLEHDHVLLLSPKESTCSRFFDLLEEAGTGGNLSTDALIAAHALEFGGTVCSNDLDFRRFPGLQLQNPLDTSA
jgi:predicted nucleic acid-binding protein